MMMITKSALKFIKSLQLKKNRIEHQCFLVEGTKSVQELLSSDFEIDLIAGVSAFLDEHADRLIGLNVNEIKPNDLSIVSSFKNNNSVIAVARMKNLSEVEMPADNYILALDDVRDPGNLGTIIRIADWYGIDQIIASATTADFYNPKVISASMGSFGRVKMHYGDLQSMLGSYDGKIYGALMDGMALPSVSFDRSGVLVMGNESVGISHEIQELISERITIPRYGSAESLNVGIATAVICDRIRSQVN
jgi:TrmH family RNA methyltransferase